MTQRKKIKPKERQRNHPLVAVDFGGSGIKVMAAEMRDNYLHILGVEQKEKYGFVEQGIVVQTTDAGTHLSRLLHLLNNRIGRNDEQPLDRVFATVGGRLLQVCDVSVKRNQISRNYISQQLKDDMLNECRQKIEGKYPQMRVLSTTPIVYILDGIEQDDEPLPTQKAKEFEIIYNVFVGLKEQEEKTVAGIARANRDIEEWWVRPEALASALIVEQESEEGAAIIDFGATTTTLSIFKNGRFLHNRVITKGGYDITRDLQSQRISFQHAELLKCKYGVAAEKFVTQSANFKIPCAEKEQGFVLLTSDMVARMIQLRLTEILTPIMKDIAHFEQDIQHVFITGGGSMLKGLVDYVQELTPLKVEYGSHEQWLDPATADEYFEPRYASLVGTLAMAADYREHHAEGEVKVEKHFLDDAINKVSKWVEITFTAQE